MAPLRGTGVQQAGQCLVEKASQVKKQNNKTKKCLRQVERLNVVMRFLIMNL